MQQVFTDQNENNYRPGFAKRKPRPKKNSPNLPTKLAAYEVQQAIALGLPDLSSQERDLLQFYTAFLNLTGLKEGKTSVWPSNRLTCKLLGISEATLRRYKATLEHKGYILRCYDRRNRPLEQGAIDLTPLLSQVKALLANIESEFKVQQAHYQSLLHQTKDKIGVLELSAYPLIAEPHKQIKSNIEVFVPKSAAIEKDGIKGRDGSENRSEAVLDMQVARTLIESSNTLTPYFGELDWSSLKDAKLWDLLDRCVRELYPERERTVQAWNRAKNRLDVQAIELLVVSLDDPNIKDGARFLGFMAYKWQGKLNLGPNLKRVAGQKLQSKLDCRTKDLPALLRQKHSIFRDSALSDCTLIAWFGRCEIEENGDHIIVWVENEFVKSRVLADYLPGLQSGCSKNIRICAC